jgi:hypothetical protein
MLKNVPDFSQLCFLPEDEYIRKANDNINAMVRDQIYRNIARNALYSLIFILDEEQAGLDSFRIVEHLKGFFMEMTKQDPEVGKQAEQLMQQAREFGKKRAEKLKPDI